MFMKKSNRNSVWAVEEWSFVRFSAQNIIGTIIFSIVYFAWYIKVVGWRSEHFTMYALLVGSYFGNRTTRDFVKAFVIFAIYWIIYDSLRVLPNYEVNPIHIREPYDLDKSLFGIHFEGQLLTLNEYFAKVHKPFWDIVAGIFYINWVPVPLAFGVYLFVKDRAMYYRFSYCFVFVNLIGFIIYYTYPAAPPWYVAQYGFEPDFSIPGNVAGLKYFDELLNVNLFHGMYEKNANVFAAMPSMHSAFPLIVLFYAIQKRVGWFLIFFVIFCIGIWSSAVYTGHHYVIDVLAGITCAIVGIFLFERYVKKYVLMLV